MARIPRNNFQTSFFRTIVQGINKEYIFNKEEDIRKKCENYKFYSAREYMNNYGVAKTYSYFFG